MARFAFVVPPLTGHVNPTLSIGSALLQRGHEVGWISLEASLQDRLPAGGRLLLAGEEQDAAAKTRNEAYLALISSKNVYGIESIRFLYEEVLVPLNRYMYPGVVRQLEAFEPSVVINDHQLFAGAIAAFASRIPYATSVTAPAAVKIMDELPKIHEWEEKQVVALQQELGLPGSQSIVCSQQMTMVYTSQEFFGEMILPGHYRFVGPVLQHRPASCAFDWNRLQTATGPKILVSIGTTFDHAHKKDFFVRVAEALGQQPLTVVVVSDPDLLNEWPANFIVQRQVPQLELMSYLDGVVCHGGHNTVCETLTHGLPLVVIPIAYDQSHVAGRVVQVESGIRLNFKRFKPVQLREAVNGILQLPQYREAARRIQASFEKAGGVQQAAQLLEQLAAPEQLQNIALVA